MKDSRNPYIDHAAPRKTHFIVKIAFFLIAVLIVVAVVKIVKKYKEDNEDSIINQPPHQPSQQMTIGSVFNGQYFDVTIDKAFLAEGNSGKDETTSLPKDDGTRYFIIGITIKNTDTEKRIMPDGRLQIEDGANELKFDNESIVEAQGGVLTESADPGITNKGKLVYRVPAGVKGKAYYYPDADNSSQRIFLLDL
jgi:hypothetical protein